MEKIFIYALCEPNTEVIRYIGQTVNPSKRLYQHIYNSKTETNYKSNWLKKLLRNEEIPNMIILEETDRELANIIEGYWIKQCIAWGFKLTNLTREGVVKTFSEESKLKMKKVGLARYNNASQEERDKQRANLALGRIKGRKRRSSTKIRKGKRIQAINIHTGEVLEFISKVELCKQLNLKPNIVDDCIRGWGYKYDKQAKALPEGRRKSLRNHTKGYKIQYTLN